LAVARLTKRAVDAMAPESLLWDTIVKGFGARRRASGVFFVVAYRSGQRKRWLTIGRQGSPWTVETARDEARRLLGSAVDARRLGRRDDPAAVRDVVKGLPTVAELLTRYLDHARAYKRASSVREDEGNIRRVILPALGHLRVDQVTSADVARLHHERRATPTNANRVRALLSHAFKMAETWGYRSRHSNPCADVKPYAETHRRRYLSPRELAQLGEALAAVETGDGSALSPVAVAAVRLLVLTGMRQGEALTLRWKNVDLEAGMLRLTTSKTGPRDVLLGAPARQLLSALPRLAGNPYVFYGLKPGSHYVGLEHAWDKIRRRAGLADVRLHDLRHTHASVAAAGGSSLLIIGALLGHAQAQTTARYAHLADHPLRDAAESTAATIANALAGSSQANVSTITRRRTTR
jgi:integrase